MRNNGQTTPKPFSMGLLAGLGFGAIACAIDSRQLGTLQEGAGGDAVTRGVGEMQPESNAAETPAPAGGRTNAEPGAGEAEAAPIATEGMGATGEQGNSASYRLTVIRTGSGGGRVTSSVPGIDCGAQCTGLFSGPVALSARTQNGENSFFTGWSESIPESACAGAQQNCSLLMDRDQSVTANFALMDHNLIFVSSKAYRPTLGGVAAFDAECNALASAAGINDAAGSAYIALMSAFGDDARPIGDILERIGTARGWLRKDGLPVADEAAALVGPVQHYPPNLTEQGIAPGYLGLGSLTWTGLGIDRDGNDHCVGWTEARPGSFATTGTSSALRWAAEAISPCDTQELPIYCLGRTKQAPLTPPPVFEGRRIWLTNTRYAPGSSTPDQRCQLERPAGVAQAAAFIAYTNRAASSVLDPDAMYVLSDGRPVGTGAALIAGQLVLGPWLLADGTSVPIFESAWVGALEARTTAGTLDSTCQDWTSSDPASSGSVEATGYLVLGSYGGAPYPCNNAWRLYCVEL